MLRVGHDVFVYLRVAHNQLCDDDEKGNGQTIVTQGKPQLDKGAGMTSYTDQEGNQREINSNDVAQLIRLTKHWARCGVGGNAH